MEMCGQIKVRHVGWKEVRQSDWELLKRSVEFGGGGGGVACADRWEVGLGDGGSTREVC